MAIFLAMLSRIGNINGFESVSNNTMLFTAIGSTTREGGYGHLLVPIPLPTLKKNTQTLMDLVDNAIDNRYDAPSSLKDNEMYAIPRIQSRINLLMLLVQKEGFVAKEMKQDQVDLLHDSLATLPTGNLDPVVHNTRTPQRSRRSATAIAAGFMGIASFDTSMFNTAQMGQLKSDIRVQADQQKLIIEQVEEQDLRIHNVTQFISKQYVEWNKLVRSSVTLSKKQAMESLD